MKNIDNLTKNLYSGMSKTVRVRLFLGLIDELEKLMEYMDEEDIAMLENILGIMEKEKAANDAESTESDKVK